VIQNALVDLWKKADAWLVGYYLLMPDHLHLFCAPHNRDFTLKAWVTHWKRGFSCLRMSETGQWQRDYWDTRLRRSESYHEKWEYVRLNPVRKNLVFQPEDWPYQGILNELRW
jgi:putative transposase